MLDAVGIKYEQLVDDMIIISTKDFIDAFNNLSDKSRDLTDLTGFVDRMNFPEYYK